MCSRIVGKQDGSGSATGGEWMRVRADQQVTKVLVLMLLVRCERQKVLARQPVGGAPF
jgi:hypothetical protein